MGASRHTSLDRVVELAARYASSDVVLNDVPMKPTFPFMQHPRELYLFRDGSLAVLDFKERPVLESLYSK